MEDVTESQLLYNIILEPEYQNYINELSDKYFLEPLSRRIFNQAKVLFQSNKLNIENIMSSFKDTDDYNKVLGLSIYYKPMNEKTMSYQIDNLKERHSKNNLRALLSNTLLDIDSKSVEAVLSDLNYKIGKLDVDDKKTDLKANLALLELFEDIEEVREGKRERIRVNIREYDTLTNGLKGGELTVIAGRPGTGKTTFALNLATNIARTGKKAYFICLEMSETQLMTKVLSYESNTNSQIIYSGKWSNAELENINTAINRVSEENYNLTFNTKLRYLEDMLIQIKKLKAKDQVDVVFIDYISLISTKTNNQSIRDKVSQISREFKLLSLELDIPIVLLSQLNREAQTREPSIADLRESGSVEQDADNILLLYADDNQRDNPSPIINCNLAKQRAGMTGKFQLKFFKATNRFAGIER